MPYHFLAVGVRAVHAMTNVSRLSQSHWYATLAGQLAYIRRSMWWRHGDWVRRHLAASPQSVPSSPFSPAASLHAGTRACRHALAQPPRHPTPLHQHSAALSSQSIWLDVVLHEGGGDKKGTTLRGSVDEKHYMSRITFHLSQTRIQNFVEGGHTLENKKLSYRRGTARCVVSIEIFPIATQQCRNYLYDKSWPNRWYEVGDLVGGNAW